MSFDSCCASNKINSLGPMKSMETNFQNRGCRPGGKKWPTVRQIIDYGRPHAFFPEVPQGLLAINLQIISFFY